MPADKQKEQNAQEDNDAQETQRFARLTEIKETIESMDKTTLQSNDAKAVLEFKEYIDKYDKLKKDPELIGQMIAAFEKCSFGSSILIQPIRNINSRLQNSRLLRVEAPGEAKAPGNGCTLRSDKKIGSLNEETNPLYTLMNHFKDKDPLSIEGAAQVHVLWQGIVSLAAVLQYDQAKIDENPHTCTINKEMLGITESLAHGRNMRVLNMRLEAAARNAAKFVPNEEVSDAVNAETKAKLDAEVTNALKAIQDNISRVLIGEINNNIIPRLREARLGVRVHVFEKEAMENAGINMERVFEIKESIDDTVHRDKELKMACEFNDNVLKLRKYLKLKASEERSAHVGHVIKDMNDFFENLDWRNRNLTTNEFPLFNAVSSPILEKVKGAKRRMDTLFVELSATTGKGLEDVENISITGGLKNKNDDDKTVIPVRAFVEDMTETIRELSELNEFKKFIDGLSKDMATVDKDLPFEFINNPEFISDPVAHFEEYRKRLAIDKGSSTIKIKEEYEPKNAALERIMDRIDELKGFEPKMLKQIHL